MEYEIDRSFDLLSDSFLSVIGDWMNTPKIKILNPPRIAEFNRTLSILLDSIERDWLVSDVSVHSDPLEIGDVTVSFDTSDFVIRDTKRFSESISKFANFELYPTIDGNMHFAAIYPSVMTVIPDLE